MIDKRKAAGGSGSKGLYLNSGLYSATYQEGVTGFQDAIAAAGLGRPDIKAEGEVRRFRVEGDKAGTLNGWYVFYPVPVPAGSFGSWKTGITENWCFKSNNQMTEDERAKLSKQMAQAKAQREQEQAKRYSEAANRAEKLWGSSSVVDVGNHGYLAVKGVGAYGLRVSGISLVIPLRDISGRLLSLQFIKPSGNKMFLSGGKTKGVFHVIGEIDAAGVVYIAEGYATAATIHEATNAPTVAAMNAGNLLSVALAIRGRYPLADIVIVGDDDRFTDGNPGKTKAMAAATAAGARLVIPEFPPDCTSGTDFNDLMQWERQHNG
jgi:putative DNA primase/helicase